MDDLSKKLDISSLKKSVIIYIITGVFILISIAIFSISMNSKTIENKRRLNYSQRIESSIKHVVGHFLKDYTYRTRRIVETSNLADLLENKDRKAMLRLLKPKFDLMQEESEYLKVMHIHLADGSSFLRVHKPELYGDDISKDRIMLRAIHKNHEIISGYETGNYATVYRIIAPIFNKDKKYIGAFEIGVNPNFILDAVHGINSFCGVVLIKENQLKLYSKPNDIVIEGYRVQSDLNQNLKNICKKFKLSKKLENNINIDIGDKKYLTHLLTLKNFNQEDSVKIIFFQDVTDITSFFTNSMYKLYAMILFIILILTYFIYRRIGIYQDGVSAIYNKQMDEIKEIEKEAKFNEKYLQTIFDVSPNIMITSDGVKIDRANPTMLKFLDYKTLDDFKDEHDCICDFFVDEDSCLKAEVNNINWLDYILSNSNKQHFVCMFKDKKRHHFIVQAHKLDIYDKHLSLVVFSDITKQKKLEFKLRDSQKLFEQFMENIPANIYIIEDNTILYANKHAKDFFAKDDLTGKVFDDILSTEDNYKLQKIFQKTLKDSNYENVIEIHNHDGDVEVHRELSFRIGTKESFKLGLIAVDITEEYNTQHEISKLKSALDNSPVSIMMTDKDGNIEYVNPNYTKMSGYSLKELIGKNPRILKSGYTSDDTYRKMWNEISSGKIWSSDYKNIAKDGSIFWEDSTIIPSFNSDREIDGYIAFKLEISDKKRLEKEIKDKDELMIAQSRHAAMGEMISMIAHQWRQPISAIAMEANNILADIELGMIDKDSLKEDSSDIIKQTQELSKTIDDFREFFKPDKLADDVDIKEVIDDALGVMGKSLENNSIVLNLDIESYKNIKTYSRELMQVIINIIKNAKEALVEKEIEDKNISIVIEHNKHVKIKICDNAGGIDKDIIDKIFDPYFTTKGKEYGTGLGLYMSKTIVEKHLNGVLSASNTEIGACFEIKLHYDLDDGGGFNK